ncbi:repetitive organellar protein-like [Ylistrum balloti]|uniref:repetitive organellar protein-like n=1 Tax=Ylistrum balloti TaxID=509963 RepID=UPI002905DBD6|nr:repetitive organellar protein-like [Ylistrum balloti]
MSNGTNSDGRERIPREKLHEQNEQLTQKQVQTLQFVQEIARENKALKATIAEYEKEKEKCKEIHAIAEESQKRLKQMQEQLQQRGDEINAMLLEKHKEEIPAETDPEMMKVLEEKVEGERQLTLEKNELRDRVDKLEHTNQELLLRLEGQTALQSRIEDEQKLSKSYKDENEELKRELESLRHQKRQPVDFEELDMMKARNNQLLQELREANQKNMELNFRLSKLEKELSQQEEDKDKVTLIENLKVKVTQMQAERGSALEKERNYEKLIRELQAEIMSLKESYVILESDKQRIYAEYQRIMTELMYLRKKDSIDSASKSFKDFVQLKRELNEVKSENSDLRRMVKPSQLPMLKDSESVKRVEERRGSGSSQASKSSNSGRQKQQRTKSLNFLTS